MTPTAFAIELYLERLGVPQPESMNLSALRALHLAHRLAIPSENLDMQLGRPIPLDIESLQKKLVGARRGGYCFEHNTLFLHALRALGFDVEPCEARVRPPGTTALTPRTHMVLIARVEGSDWLLDVGFGASGPLEPVALSDKAQDQHGWVYRVVREEQTHVLQSRGAEGWRDLYAFVPERRYPVDFEVANWYTSTHPESLFVRTLTAQCATPEARHILHGLTYTRSTPDGARRPGRSAATISSGSWPRPSGSGCRRTLASVPSTATKTSTGTEMPMGTSATSIAPVACCDRHAVARRWPDRPPRSRSRPTGRRASTRGRSSPRRRSAESTAPRRSRRSRRRVLRCRRALPPHGCRRGPCSRPSP